MSTSLSKSQSSNLTVQELLSLPRPQAAIVSSNGKLALWPSTTFSFEDSRTERTLSLVKINKESSSIQTTITSSSAEETSTSTPEKVLEGLTSLECAWIDEHTILYLRPKVLEVEGEAEKSRGFDHPLGVSDLNQKERLSAFKKVAGEGVEIWAKDLERGSTYRVTSLPVSISNLKVSPVQTKKEEGAILSFSASVYSDGDIFNVANKKKEAEVAARGSDVRVYDSLFVRHWDTWSSDQINQIFYIRLTKNPDSFYSNSDVDDDFEHVTMPRNGKESVEGQWSALEVSRGLVRTVSVKSPLAGTTLECPVGPFGGAFDFSVSSTHLLFHAKDPLLNPAYHTRTQVYLVPLQPRSAADAKPKAITIGSQGACSSPIFSVDGTRIAWLEMRIDGNEADKNRVMIYEVESGKSYGVTEEWDRSPSQITWCPCGEKIYLITDEEGHGKIFQLRVPIERSESEITPEVLKTDGTVNSVSTLSTSEILVTSSTFTHPNVLSTVKIDPSPPSSPNAPPQSSHLSLLATLTPTLAKDKSLSAGESFWFVGAEGIEVHGFILFPPGFKEEKALDKDKKWPLAFLVHGGPESAWQKSWSTRWNPNMYTSNGFITVLINPSGSTGYGDEFTKSIHNQWGGKPFQDLVAGLHFVKHAYPEIDADRMAMLGASYGGYMANWIQGHNDQMGFKCIVCHDGVFSTPHVWYSTEELYFPEGEFGGTPWEKPEEYSRWNPTNHISKWKTPQLVIHGGQDFRLPVTEGLGVFNTLQRLGIPSRFVFFESENHWVLNAQNGVRWHEEVFKWLNHYTSS